MPIRRLNYTGRKRLSQADTRIVVIESGDGAVKFDADLNLDDYDLPADALLFVEAYRRTFMMRFPFGTVGRPTAPDNKSLTEFGMSEGILFRVKVTSADEPKALLLAAANRLRPRRPDEKEDRRRSLLPVCQSDSLGDQVYRVDFSDGPQLLVNSRVGDWRALAMDPAFVSLVLPAALREILTRILRVEGHFDVEDDEDWRSQWLRFATLLPGISEVPKEGTDEDEVDDWIDEAVAAFCRKSQIIRRFLGSRIGEGAA